VLQPRSRSDAIFRGAELAWQWDVMPLGPGLSSWAASATVRATFTDSSSVPRIPPARLGSGAY
jgi:iron complex outermembrane receptor protein